MSRQDLQTVIVNRGSLEADVENAKAALELAQIDLQNTRIVAPRDGQLGQIAVRLGAYVAAGTHLTTLVPPQHWVIANIKETQLANLRVGQPVKFTVDALNDKAYQGRVESISPATGVEFSAITPDNATGNFVKIAQRIPVRIEVLGEPEAYRLLRPRHVGAGDHRHAGGETMTLRPIAGLLMMAIPAGCQSVDVEPAKSSLHIPAQWRATSGPASPTEQLWWRNFHDSNLNRYVDQALKNNSDVLIARERINEYRGPGVRRRRQSVPVA